MKKLFAYIIAAGLFLAWFPVNAQNASRQSYKIYVDNEGVMRRSDNNQEVSYYGTNYTLPFAHAYRAVGQLGVDRKDAINRDVYHLKRLGFNGFRLHLWDVELADSLGNIIQNEHLDLLDYLIARLEENGIDIILTAQTNFGNGYPEKNIDTGAFSYDFDKCEIHENKKAKDIQANYLKQLASHVNPYTGRSYAGDNAIIAIEINNEPCHKAPAKEVTAYINEMVKALKKGGFDKPILYNVSHNPEVTEAYYNADIQGTTYQWYPTGLVAGHQRKGNFLPYVDNYPIPWKDSMKNYDKMARVVYEFDPGDVLYSYLYPAIARTFRKEGFQWITQFAYDPIDIAKYNTEYQTHFLNLAYTPSKALSMLIAGEAARNIPRGADYGTFPKDTVFGDFTVSYDQDLSVYNAPEKFYHSNPTTIEPVVPKELKNIAGVGSSPIVNYEGTGAYFLDEIKPDLWRLEVMPDVVITSDPFEKPSLKKEIANIYYNEHPLKISLPQLGNSFYFQGINDGNNREGQAHNSTINIFPGSYLLSSEPQLISKALESDNAAELRAFVAPKPSNNGSYLLHTPVNYIPEGSDLIVEAKFLGANPPEEITLYPSTVSFWNDQNTLFPMKLAGENTYQAVIPANQLGWDADFSYNIVVKQNGQNHTWPQNLEGTPLDWDFTDYEYYTSRKISPDNQMVLLNPKADWKWGQDNIELSMIPEAWNFKFTPEGNEPVSPDFYKLTAKGENEGKIIVSRFVGDELKEAPFLDKKSTVVVKLWPNLAPADAAQEGVSIGFTGKNGANYIANLSPEYLSEVPTKLHQDNPHPLEYRVPLSAFTQAPTFVLPPVYPSFLPREVEVGALPFNLADTEFVQLIFPTQKDELLDANIYGIWLE